MAALRIVDAGDIGKQDGRLLGRRHGTRAVHALGLSALAVDADGDGRRDLWGSIPDAMHSAGPVPARSRLGTRTALGTRGALPEDFDYALAGRDAATRAVDGEWSALGVTDAFGRALPARRLPAALLVPSGHRARLSDLPQLRRHHGLEPLGVLRPAVGRLADEIAGARRCSAPRPLMRAILPTEVLALQPS
jgi:membrane-bound lytic murein transglycosylase B